MVNSSGNQFGFAPGNFATDSFFMLRQFQQKYNDKNKWLYHIFFAQENAFDRVPRRALVWALRRQLVPEKLIKIVMALNSGARSSVVATGGPSDSFEISVGGHQGSALSPFLFNLIVEEATKECKRGVPWDILYADDLVLTSESIAEALERWWKFAIESKGLEVNTEKTNVLVFGK